MSRLHIAAIFSLALLGFSSSAIAQGAKGTFALSATVGGALPYSTGGGGYMVTRLTPPDEGSLTIGIARQAPYGAMAKNVFDDRPQVGLGGRYELGGTSSGAKLSLRGVVSAGMEREGEGGRAVLGLAGLSVLF
jgi:hypothetical protein